MSWGCVYALFARYIIYPFLLRAITLVVSAADAAQKHLSFIKDTFILH